MADELDDGLLIDEHLVAYSDDENEHTKPKATTSTSHTDKAAEKKRKRREQAKAQRRKKSAAFQEQVEAARTVAMQPADLQADYLSALQRKAFPKLSELELSEMRLAAAAFLETYQFTRERTLDNLSTFVRECVCTDASAFQSASHPWMQAHGTPRILVITGNAQRAADVARALRPLLPSEERPTKRRKGDKPTPKDTPASSGPNVAKLFARHFKVEEQAAWLETQVTPAAVGTPHRIQALLDKDALHIEHLAAIIIDFSWTDAKNRTVLDTPETRDATLSLLSNTSLRAALTRPSAPCQLALY